MPGFSPSVVRGILLGAGAAAIYAMSRDTAVQGRIASLKDRAQSTLGEDSGQTYAVDWLLATRVAIRSSGDAPALHPAAKHRLHDEYVRLLAEIEVPLAEYTGNQLSLANTRVEVMDRPDWVRANMANFREMLEPVEDFYRESERSPRDLPLVGAAVQRGARAVLSVQVGVLVGYLARRVLGQYDMSLLGREPIEGGKLYFVEPNIRRVEQSLGVPRDEFRRWIALHEATHAHEFEVHPWVRDYMNTTLRSYLRLLLNDMDRQTGSESIVVALANRLAGNVRRGHNLLYALMTPAQRELVSRLQALMALAEGYSNHVMNAVGRTMLPSFEHIHDRVEHRARQRSRAEMLFLRLTGLAMKMEQYRLGEQFVSQVVLQRSMAFMNQAWESPENLPSEAEIRQPARWIARLEATS
jgi:coenzyme F420 biosynthesis associated uncharacterized protein